MAELPDGITQEELDRYAKLDAGIKALQAEHKKINEKIKKVFTQPGTFVFGKVIIDRSSVVGVDVTAVEENFPPSKYPEYYKAAVDQDSLPDEVKAEYFTLTERLSVKVAK